MTLRQQYGYSVAVVTSDCTEVPAGREVGRFRPVDHG